MTPDSQLAEALAAAAGALLLEIRAAWDGDDRAQLGREGDLRSNALILGRLAERRPHDSVLSEESADDPTRLTASRVWIIDPLDGTREFTMQGRDDWAVHVALWEEGQGLTASAVAQPSLGVTYATGAGDYHPAGARPEPIILVSDSRPPAFAAPVADAIGGRVQQMGSAGAKAMAVLRGDADAYLHAGGQWEWDSAAPAGVLRHAGFHTSRLDGSPLEYNHAKPYLPDLVMCTPALAPALLAAIAAVTGG